ncbi:hypothetical protein GDO86_010016, partial [Hymenochirus boettgeri]
ELFGYKTVRWRQALCMIGYFCSLGFLRLLFNWKPELDVWAQCVPCSFEEADIILLKTTGEISQYIKKKVLKMYPHISGSKPEHQIIADKNSMISKCLMQPQGMIRYMQIQKIRYVWNAADRKFQKIGILEEELSYVDIHSIFGSGLTSEEQEIRWVFNPFYAFQAYTLCMWISNGYIEYSIVILAMTILSIIATIYNLRKQSVKLHKMVKAYNSIKVKVLRRNGVIEDVESQYLVPGDVLILAGNKLFLPCDAILIHGGCTVNEGMLTGESIPVTKIPLPHTDSNVPWKIQSGEDYKKHILFCGTEVIQTKALAQGLVKAVVLRTGFNTAKGDLVRSILYNKPVNIKLHKEAIRFLLILVVIALCGVAYTAVIYTKSGASIQNTVLMSFLMLTIAVNPALPASLTLVLLYAQTRLKKQGIFCISPQRINIAGQLNLVCFDKEIHYFSSGNILPWGPVLGAMASCHSIILLDGKMHGDPLDMKMFEGTGWVLEHQIEQGKENGKSISCTIVSLESITILHQFPFTSALQRMSVITQVSGETHLTVFLKGAPEIVIQLCKSETVPHDVYDKLDTYTKQGFRVIGLAYRLLQKKSIANIQELERDEVERNLTFLALLILENRLKPETSAVIQELKEAKIRNVMITGDNLQTAVNIGINCGMIPKTSKVIIIEANEPENDNPASLTWKHLIDKEECGHQSYGSHEIQVKWNNTSGSFHFAMSGKSFQIIIQHFYDYVPKILLNGTIFARMTPQQKSTLIEEFQKLDYFVGMCGDGANDCGKHLSLPLSLPKLQNIECVPKFKKEGRNTLEMSVSMFKFMATLPLIALVSIVFLFLKQTLLSSSQYLMQSIAIIISFCLTSGLNGSAPKLARYRPSGQLLSPPLLLSILLHFLFTVVLANYSFYIAPAQPWYNETDVFSACLPSNHSTENITMREPEFSENYLATTEWIITGFNLIVIEFVFSKGRPFRQRLYTNYLLTLLIALQVAAYLFFLFSNIESVHTAFEMVCIPFYWRIYILIMVLVHFLVSYGVEEGFIENRKLWKVIKKIFNYQSKSQYKQLQRSLGKDTQWPPQPGTDYESKSVSVMDSKIMVFTNACNKSPTREHQHGKLEQL